MTPDALERHIGYCRRYYDCIPLEEAVQRARTDRWTRRPLLTLTFDDGYWDGFAHARPVLNALDVRATFFVITSLIGADRPPWYDELARAATFLRAANASSRRAAPQTGDPEGRWLADCLGGPCPSSVSAVVRRAKTLTPPQRRWLVQRALQTAVERGYSQDSYDRIMNRDELIRLAEDGHEVASHSRSHAILTQLSSTELADELEGSRLDLSRLLTKPIASVAYPNGNYDRRVVEAARRAGYRCAVTTEHGLNRNPMESLSLRRVFISECRVSGASGTCSEAVLQLELTGLADTLLLRRFRRVTPE